VTPGRGATAAYPVAPGHRVADKQHAAILFAVVALGVLRCNVGVQVSSSPSTFARRSVSSGPSAAAP
jgi:hypothetical protein